MIVNICGVPHKVIECEDKFDVDAHFGQIDFKACEIRINKDLSDANKKETICHEMMHGIFAHLGYNDYAQNEQLVQALGNAIYQGFEIKPESAELIADILNGDNDNRCAYSDDCVSRQAVLTEIDKYLCGVPYEKGIDKVIRDLPPVTPKQKTGYWIKIKPYPLQMHEYECSECSHETDDNTENYCSECGAKMESEGENNDSN